MDLAASIAVLDPFLFLVNVSNHGKHFQLGLDDS